MQFIVTKLSKYMGESSPSARAKAGAREESNALETSDQHTLDAYTCLIAFVRRIEIPMRDELKSVLYIYLAFG